jgi:hypothetical protein
VSIQLTLSQHLLPGMASTLASTYAPVETRPAVQVASKTLSKHGKFSTTNVFKLAGIAAAAPVDGVVPVCQVHRGGGIVAHVAAG